MLPLTSLVYTLVQQRTCKTHSLSSSCQHLHSQVIVVLTHSAPWVKFQAKDSWVTSTTQLMRREEFEQRGITTQLVRYIFPLFHAPPPPPLPATAQAPPPPPPTPDAPQPLVSPGSSGFNQGVLLEDTSKVSGGSRSQRTYRPSLNQLRLVPMNDAELEEEEEEEEEEPDEGLSEDREMGQQGIQNAGSPMAVTHTNIISGLDSGKEPEDELDSNCDLLWDYGGFVVPFLQSFFPFFSFTLVSKQTGQLDWITPFKSNVTCIQLDSLFQLCSLTLLDFGYMIGLNSRA